MAEILRDFALTAVYLLLAGGWGLVCWLVFTALISGLDGEL